MIEAKANDLRMILVVDEIEPGVIVINQYGDDLRDRLKLELIREIQQKMQEQIRP